MKEKPPRIVVILPTFNGGAWLSEQVNSILEQKEVEVELVISDDMSSDNTFDLLRVLACQDARVHLLEIGNRCGSAGQHFFRLIREANFSDCEYVAFADQDDVWQPDKLIRHVNLLKKHDVDAVSSNVEAFWRDGKSRLIKKNQPQQIYDYLFESAGPGCSFLMRVELVEKIRQFLQTKPAIAKTLALHDWLTYAICRSSGGKWYIDDVPSLQYRQHDHNVLGANNGFRSKWSRLRQISNGWYRKQVISIIDACGCFSSDPFFLKLSSRLRRNRLSDRVWFIMHIRWFRRAWRDRMFLAMCIALGWF